MSGPAGIGEVLHNSDGLLLMIMIFSKKDDILESNEAEVLAILGALHVLVSHYNAKVIVESESVKVFWASS